MLRVTNGEKKKRERENPEKQLIQHSILYHYCVVFVKLNSMTVSYSGCCSEELTSSMQVSLTVTPSGRYYGYYQFTRKALQLTSYT